jgi:hypothetical protein
VSVDTLAWVCEHCGHFHVTERERTSRCPHDNNPMVPFIGQDQLTHIRHSQSSR